MPNNIFGNEGLKAPPPPPDPLNVVDAVGDLVMQIPAIPGRVAQNLGAAVQAGGSRAMQAVGVAKVDPGDVPPDPVSFVRGGVDYILNVPRTAVEGVKGVLDAIGETVDDVMSRGRRLTGK